MGTLYICAYISAINDSNQTTFFFVLIPVIPRCLPLNFTAKSLIFDLYEISLELFNFIYFISCLCNYLFVFCFSTYGCLPKN